MLLKLELVTSQTQPHAKKVLPLERTCLFEVIQFYGHNRELC